MTDLRYPVGTFQRKEDISDKERQQYIRDIADAPANFRRVVSGLSDDQLSTPYRPGGWSVKQVIHHMPDSHMNAYIRFKLALTEDQPTIKTYSEQLWAELHDARNAPVEASLLLLESLHARWAMLLNAMEPVDFERPLVHPDNGLMKLHMLLQLYAWHGRHHLAHIVSLRERMGWK